MKLYLFCLFLLFSSAAQAIVVQISEFYNPKLKQAVVVLGDMHLSPSEIDKQQVEAVVSILKKHQGHCVVECGFSPKEDDPSSKMFLVKLLATGQDGGLSIVDAECRRILPDVMHLISDAFKDKNYSAIAKSWLNERKSKAIYNMFLAFFEETCKGLEVCDNEISQIKIPAMKESLNDYSQQMKLLFKEASILPKEKEIEEDDIQSVVTFLIENIFVDNGDADATLNTNSIYHKLEEINYFRLEANILKEIAHHQDKKLVFVATGKEHMARIESTLKASGFNLENDVSHPWEDIFSMDKDFSELSKYIVENCTIDVDEFMNQSKILNT